MDGSVVMEKGMGPANTIEPTTTREVTTNPRARGTRQRINYSDRN